MKVNKTVKRIWNITTTVLVAIVVLIAIFLMGSRIVGYRVFNVLSPSMEPKFSTGDLIYVKEIYRGECKTPEQRQEKIDKVQAMIDSGELKVGDPITFVMNENLVIGTHSIVRIDEENKVIYTQGLANDTEDPPLKYENVIGEAKFAIPLLGYFSDWVQNPPGTYIAITIGVLLILAVFLPDFFVKKKEEPVIESEDSIREKEELEKMRREIAREREELEAVKSQKSDNTQN